MRQGFESRQHEKQRKRRLSALLRSVLGGGDIGCAEQHTAGSGLGESAMENKNVGWAEAASWPHVIYMRAPSPAPSPTGVSQTTAQLSCLKGASCRSWRTLMPICCWMSVTLSVASRSTACKFLEAAENCSVELVGITRRIWNDQPPRLIEQS